MSREPFQPFTYITSHPQGIPCKIVEPTPEFVREVEWAMEGASVREVAQWIVDRIEEHGSQHAREVMDMDGNGPFCSYCGGLGFMCGHPERSLNSSVGEVE